MNDLIYRKQNTYLVIDNKTNEYIHWVGNKKDIFYAGSIEDALCGLNTKDFRPIAVCDAPPHIQKQYEEAIEKAIKNGEIDLRGIIPSKISVNVCYYADESGIHFDIEHMQDEFNSNLNALEEISKFSIK